MSNTEKDKGVSLYTAFPKKIQKIVKGLVQYENYNEEYLLVSLLSATSSAAGNAVQIRIKGEWVSNPALYAILVGNPGMGKSQPMDFAYKPIRANEKTFRDEYMAKLEAYEQQIKIRHSPVMPARPSLRRTIISDFTPEALMMSHSVNPRGVTIYVDEIMGMFNSANRYNNSQLIEQLLTAYSGKPLDVARVSMDVPLHIEHPCISIIGTTQTTRVIELFRNGYQQNGLLDRFVFSYPLSTVIPLWNKDKAATSTKVYFDEWETILNKILSLPYDEDAKEWHELPFTPAARDYYYDWYNELVASIAEDTVDDNLRERMMKTNLNVARIALSMQIMRWACDEATLISVDLISLKSAIQISDYFEGCYVRIADFVKSQMLNVSSRRLLRGVGELFKTSEAITAGRDFGMSERHIKRLLTTLSERKLLVKISHGVYQKTGKCKDMHL